MAWEDYKEYIATEVKALNEKRPKRPFKGCPNCGFSCNKFGKDKPDCDNCDWCLTDNPDLYNSKQDKTYERNSQVIYP